MKNTDIPLVVNDKLLDSIYFGVELEGYIPCKMRQKLSDLIFDTDLSFSRQKPWDLCRDKTIIPPAGYDDVEIRTAILHGSEDLKRVQAVFFAVWDFGFRSNESCGLHVHISRKSADWISKDVRRDCFQNLYYAAIMSTETYEADYISDERINAEYCKRPTQSEFQCVANGLCQFDSLEELEFLDNDFRRYLYFSTQHKTAEWRGRQAYDYPNSIGYIAALLQFTADAFKNPEARLPSRQELLEVSKSPVFLEMHAPTFNRSVNPGLQNAFL